MLCGRPMRESHYPACASSPTGCHSCFTAWYSSLSCLVGAPSCGLAAGSWRTADQLDADRSYPSALYCAGGLPPGFLCQGTMDFAAGLPEQGKGEKLDPNNLDRQHLETRHDAMYLLLQQPAFCLRVLTVQRTMFMYLAISRSAMSRNQYIRKMFRLSWGRAFSAGPFCLRCGGLICKFLAAHR